MISTAVALDEVLLNVLPGDRVFAVGGRVRDELRSELEGQASRSKDLDYVVVGTPLDDLVDRLSRVGRVDLVGASFAVLKLTTHYGTADVALPRRERSSGVGHRDFVVESGPDIPLADDLARRDFRMNMVARRLRDGQLVDPCRGVADIQAHRIDIVTEAAFDEDPLRMLRAAQFAARFRYRVTARTRVAMMKAAPLVTTVSAERIGEEIQKLLALAPRPSIGIELLRETGVLAHVWPELLEGVGIEQNEWHAYDVYRHNLATVDAVPVGDVTLRFAALLHDIGKPRTKDGPHFYRHEHVGAALVAPMLKRLRTAGEVVATVEQLVESHMYVADPELSDKAIRRFVRRVGSTNLDRLFALRAADIAGSGLPKRDDSNERFQARVAHVVAERPPMSVRDLAITGAQIVDLLIARGYATADFRGDERVGTTLRALFEEVTDDPSRNVPPLLLARAEEFVDAQYGPS